MEQLYDNLSEAQAFEISFTNFVDIYDDTCLADYAEELCDRCGRTVQCRDYLIPKSRCKKPYGILSSCEFGVNQDLHAELIEKFDVTEEDFRPIRNKKGDIVFYQITPQHTMLPIHAENNWNPYSCSRCGSVRYSHKEYENDKGEFYYYISQQALDDMHDFNVTYERFDCHEPSYIISKRVYEFLVERYPRTHYFPFFLKK